jgi:hypothetical protein
MRSKIANVVLSGHNVVQDRVESAHLPMEPPHIPRWSVSLSKGTCTRLSRSKGFSFFGCSSLEFVMIWSCPPVRSQLGRALCAAGLPVPPSLAAGPQGAARCDVRRPPGARGGWGDGHGGVPHGGAHPALPLCLCCGGPGPPGARPALRRVCRASHAAGCRRRVCGENPSSALNALSGGLQRSLANGPIYLSGSCGYILGRSSAPCVD